MHSTHRAMIAEQAAALLGALQEHRNAAPRAAIACTYLPAHDRLLIHDPDIAQPPPAEPVCSYVELAGVSLELLAAELSEIAYGRREATAHLRGVAMAPHAAPATSTLARRRR